MKPMVVSAARAGLAPSTEPRVSAALPCKRRRREILPKSISCPLWRSNRRLSRGSASPGEARDEYRKLHATAALLGNLGKILKCMDYNFIQNLGTAPID